ncbi:hypothetical protein DDD_1824 [Nonlabens dokdonensis DSW-6]|uniref:Uncharacterized protein n=1 Tax=Nonlabens dokdonensis (strain DSM 17205 / KCTC 12402 / DSW-6) TaxID=592029 RepID=L7W9P6_NONDD|nr:hypothetical protein DDD_1824 [Nonlabens dokdonensis DSW-6]
MLFFVAPLLIVITIIENLIISNILKIHLSHIAPSSGLMLYKTEFQKTES